MKNALRLLIAVVILLIGTIGLRNLVAPTATVSANGIHVMDIGGGNPPPPDCPGGDGCTPVN